MSATSFRFRVRAPNGQQSTLQPLCSSATIDELQSSIISALQLKNTRAACIEIKYVFPPARVISAVPPNTPLSSLGITSGNLIIAILSTPPSQPQPQKQSLPTSSTSTNSKLKNSSEEKHAQTNASANAIANKDSIDAVDASGTVCVKIIDSDNSCLFNAVLFAAENGVQDKDKGQELRQVIASIVMSDPDKYNAAVLGKSVDAYVQYILGEKTWGGSIELSVLANYYGVQINAIDVVTLNVHKFGEGDAYKQCIYVLYDGIHYDALYMQLLNGQNGHGQGDRYRFKSDDDAVYAQAFSIAAELNAKKQFTDVYNFALLCNMCGAKLKGQSEAQKHAETTGHADFSQYQ